jgi:hypothetical protein
MLCLLPLFLMPVPVLSVETNPVSLPSDKRKKETTDPDFVWKAINKTGSCSQHLLPVLKCGFEPLHPPNLCTRESRNATAPERFRLSFRCLSLGPLPATVDAIGKNIIPATLVEKHRSCSLLLTLSHFSLSRNRIIAPQAMNLVWFASSEDEQSRARAQCHAENTSASTCSTISRSTDTQPSEM